MLKAVLFDMDGVLLDSEEFITRAAVQMFAEKGFQVQEADFKPFTGMGENRFLGGVAEKYGIPFSIETDKARAYKIYGEMVKGRLAPLPGVREFIGKCRQKNLKIAVATSADEVKMLINLKETGLEPALFDGLVNGDMVVRKKPFPDLYLMAASLLKVGADECLVTEDSISGMEAAIAAGCRCMAITTSFPASAFDKAEWFAANLQEAPDECLEW
jgi:HAD superfamily hydrolase (TIGR01509 family)